MPVMTPEDTPLIRAVLEGPPKMRKTWWALRAAELGYNVMLADFDDGAAVAINLPAASIPRIYRLDMRGMADGAVKNASFASMSLAASGSVVYYDEEKRERVMHKKLVPATDYARLDLLNSTPRDLLIVDSWTVVSSLIKTYLNDKVDPLAVPDYAIEQSEYNKMRMLADALLANLQKLPCHVIVIAHCQEYAKRKANAGSKEKPETAIEFIKQTAISVTKAHGEVLLGWASDVLLFDMPSAMQGVYVNNKGGPEAVAGSRTVAPQRKKWEDFGIETLLPAIDASEISPRFNSKAVRADSGQSFLDEIKSASASAPVLNATKKPTLNLGTKS